jgi:hypothetical protein
MARLDTTNGEKPKSRPPIAAAGDHRTQRRRSQHIDSALRAGARVEATLRVATGPQIHVTGARGTPTASIPVLESRLRPVGWKRRLEKNGLVPWAMASAGQARNHVVIEGSSQPQRVTVEGWVDHACHHRTTDRVR